jgi:hypothetical protein
MRASLLAAVCLGLSVSACGSAASHSASGPGAHAGASTSASAWSATGTGRPSGGGPNSFRGSVSSASGAYAGEGGRSAVALEVRGRGASRPIKLTFRSLPCQGAPQCVQLDGTLTGRISTQPRGVPDTGRSFAIRATGRLTTLGHVSARGIIQGTGFIAHGHVLLELTLTNPSGSVTLRAQSSTVGGFSSP